eukprot:TRINITY_DN1228_c0_g1_i5.p3 TRINITY_DN1228_c0_g1~~TRINITY_DN1228_c0_g1_i5.p3  ORF type:complete len:161 (+),score=21.77 TRINITY_DN1228_c0_g1_i5:950-1432(+)
MLFCSDPNFGHGILTIVDLYSQVPGPGFVSLVYCFKLYYFALKLNLGGFSILFIIYGQYVPGPGIYNQFLSIQEVFYPKEKLFFFFSQAYSQVPGPGAQFLYEPFLLAVPNLQLGGVFFSNILDAYVPGPGTLFFRIIIFLAVPKEQHILFSNNSKKILN